jgi:Ca2+-transporting ATPase
VAYLLGCNLSEVLAVGLAVLFTLPLPMLPLQILYLNLVTDVFPAFALGMGEGDPDILKRPPRNPREPILGRSQWAVIVLHSLALTAATFGALAAAWLWLDLDGRSTVTVTFLTLAFAQLWHAFNMRHPRSGLLRNEVTRNPWLWGALLLCTALLAAPPYVPPVAEIMHLVPPTPIMWVVILGASVAPLVVTQGVMLTMALLCQKV